MAGEDGFPDADAAIIAGEVDAWAGGESLYIWNVQVSGQIGKDRKMTTFLVTNFNSNKLYFYFILLFFAKLSFNQVEGTLPGRDI